VGCNVHAKNTLDLNYLYAAEHQHGARILAECLAEKIVPLDGQGNEDSTANGQFGYRVIYLDDVGTRLSLDTQRVVVAAGTLGTNEILLRCRDEHGCLPRISQQLGRRFSGNGDFVSLVPQGTRDADPTYGPVITRYVDYDYVNGAVEKNAFLLEDAAYPNFAAWYVEGLRPMFNPGMAFRKLKGVLTLFWRRTTGLLMGGKWNGSVAEYFRLALGQDLSYRSSVLLCMGKDKGDGVLSLKRGRFDLMWPQQTSRPLYEAIIACGKRFQAFVGSGTYLVQPTWTWPLRNNITVHPLGGCALADSPEQGVVSATAESRGQVFGYQGLYVADGSLVPGSLGANPSATIAALSEWIAEGITGQAPDDTLGVPQP
jgi:cholesterol oxidase